MPHFGCLNIWFNLNFTVSSLQRNSDLLSYFQTFSRRIFATFFTLYAMLYYHVICWLRLYYFFVGNDSSSISCSDYSVGFLPTSLQFYPHWRHMISYSFLVFQDCFWLFWGKFLDFASIISELYCKVTDKFQEHYW